MAVLEIGSELGGCRIERQIGRGGMGVVYLAHQLGTDRKVALKAIAPSFSQDRIFRERFQREARLAALLQHPNVITVYDAGEA
jgi:serine/threonine-protein kinase